MKRRKFLTMTGAAAGAILIREAGLSGAIAQAPNLPARGEFTVRNGVVLTMDATLGDFRDGDIHVRNGQIVAVGPKLPGGGTSIEGTGFIALPGLIDTHQQTLDLRRRSRASRWTSSRLEEAGCNFKRIYSSLVCLYP